jgi:bacterioferritin
MDSSRIEIQKIRENAMQSISDGAVTADYPLDVTEACRMLNEALASEILCVLRYRHHQIAAKGIDFPQVAAEFKEHAESEEKHALMLAGRISQLGGKANFDPVHITTRAATEFGTGADLLSMIKDDLVAERIAIEVYRKTIKWFGAEDSTTRKMLEDILVDEEEHANDMADLLAKVGRSKKEFHS